MPIEASLARRASSIGHCHSGIGTMLTRSALLGVFTEIGHGANVEEHDKTKLAARLVRSARVYIEVWPAEGQTNVCAPPSTLARC